MLETFSAGYNGYILAAAYAGLGDQFHHLLISYKIETSP